MAARCTSHNSALLNCCPDPITYDVEIGDTSILIVERSESVCDCDCCFHISMVLDDVPPGLWDLTYRWLDIETYEWVDVDLPIEVPSVGQVPHPFVSAQSQSGCLEPAEMPDPSGDHSEDERGSWGRLKEKYRSS